MRVFPWASAISSARTDGCALDISYSGLADVFSTNPTFQQRRPLMKLLATLVASVLAVSAFAQSPVGLWKTIDDATGKEKSLIRISESGGVFSGKVEKLLAPDAKPDTKCEQCTDARKDQLVVGMTVLRNVKKNDEQWDGGDILDPNNGKVYKVRLRFDGDSKKLEVRGYIGAPMFGRSQNWIRVE
jgi:uncharacterized protein (DUF2147 family)